MRIAFRTDASCAIGTGHLMRCLTLAEAARARGASILFICREHAGHLCDLVAARGFELQRLAAPGIACAPRSDDDPAHAAWLGAAWSEDAAQTRSAIAAGCGTVDWLVVDHYGIDARWEHALRGDVGALLVIDDLADRPHEADFLLDQNLVADMRTRYIGRTPTGCRLLLGPRHALLQPIYADVHARIPARAGPIRRVLVYFGGADNDRLAERALAALLRLQRPEVAIDVVVGRDDARARALACASAPHTQVTIHGALATLAPLIAKADLAVGASGATSWERLCLGLPALVVTLARNQVAIASELHAKGLVRWLGHQEDVDEDAMVRALVPVFEQGLDAGWSRACAAQVDGKGTWRVLAALTARGSDPLRLRHARPDDTAVITECSTHAEAPAAIACSSDAAAVPLDDALRDLDGARVYIADNADGVAIGAARWQRNAAGWSLRCGPVPPCRGRGIERHIAAQALALLRSETDGPLALEPAAMGDRGPHGHDLHSGAPRSARAPLRLAVCSDASSWINAALPEMLLDWAALGHRVMWAHAAEDVPPSDACFYLGWGRIVGSGLLARHAHNLVVHESALPAGRGWSPLTWQVLEGAKEIPITLFEAAASVDSGAIYLQESIALCGDELVEDLRLLQGEATCRLCRDFVDDFPRVLQGARRQHGTPSLYRRRTPSDAQLALDATLREQVNLLRVCDNRRYPAWFDWQGTRMRILVEKASQADGKENP